MLNYIMLNYIMLHYITIRYIKLHGEGLKMSLLFLTATKDFFVRHTFFYENLIMRLMFCIKMTI